MDSTPSRSSTAQPRRVSRGTRRLLAIIGMLVTMTFAYALLMQESGKLFMTDKHGHVHFVWVDRVVRGLPPAH